MSTFTPGATVTVADLAVGDVVFLQERSNPTGLPTPTHPVRVVSVDPLPDGTVRTTVRNANSSGSAEPRLLGNLPATRQFRVAVPATDPQG